jgi:hypothetical protein
MQVVSVLESARRFDDWISPDSKADSYLDLPDRDQRLCCYCNFSRQIQVIRIDDPALDYFERVVFPGQRLLFEAPISAVLKVYHGRVTVIEVDQVSCRQLQVQFEVEAKV